MGAPTAPGMGGAEGMMKTMKYIFPVMIVLMARSYPAGLAIYWFFSQVIQIFFNLRFRKIREELKSGNKSSRKKGK
jgi:YidC/Oxa1 family membrane protein insertase